MLKKKENESVCVKEGKNREKVVKNCMRINKGPVWRAFCDVIRLPVLFPNFDLVK